MKLNYIQLNFKKNEIEFKLLAPLIEYSNVRIWLIWLTRWLSRKWLPWRTCRVTLEGSALDGVQEYLPESDNLTWRRRSEDVVTGLLLSVTMATPPRGESCVSTCVVRVMHLCKWGVWRCIFATRALPGRDDAKRRTREVRDWTGRCRSSWRGCRHRRGTRVLLEQRPAELLGTKTWTKWIWMKTSDRGRGSWFVWTC